MRSDYQVQVSVLTTHEFVINANTPEEACAVAEQYIGEGERAEVNIEILDSEALLDRSE